MKTDKEILKEIFDRRTEQPTDDELSVLVDIFNDLQDRKQRATGRTTRLVDMYVQDLFKVGFISVQDHHNEPHSHYRLADMVCDRVVYEHRIKLIKIQKDGFYMLSLPEKK
jgi:hypothetical protein